MDTSILLSIVGLPFFGACAILLAPTKYTQWPGKIAVFVSLATFALTLKCWAHVADSSIFIKEFAEVPGVALSIALRADRLGIFFSLLVTLVGAAIAQYARFYFKGEVVRRFWFLFMIFQGSMLGIALSESLLLLFVFWELTTISSCLLIAHDHQEKSARTAASQALLITAAGGLCLLAGIILLGSVAGTDQIQKLSQSSQIILNHENHRLILGLLLLGAFTKSAQFPFHFWLPGAMAAPTPISAYLHSATMVKAGIILLARLFPIFHASDIWQPILGTVGLLTFVIGSWNAFRCADMKKLLAHSTVAYLGVLTAIYGYSTGAEVKGELLHIANHTFYKSSLFLLLGWFEKVARTRDINLLDREIWYRRQPLGTLLFSIAGLSIVGGPLLLSYTSKDLFFDVVFKETGEIWPAALVTLGSILTVAFSIKLVVTTFWGTEEPEESRTGGDNKVSPWLLIIPGLLILPQLLGGVLLSPITETLKEPLHEWSGGLAFWTNLDVKTTVKIVIFAGGIGIYFFWRRLANIPLIDGFLPRSLRLAQQLLKSVSLASHWMQGNNYQYHVAIILIASVAFPSILFTIEHNIPWYWNGKWGWDQTLFFLFPSLLVIISSLGIPFVRDRITVVILLGLITFGVALLYILMRAPDLAMTQLLVDTLGLIVLLLVFHHFRGMHEVIERNMTMIRVAVSITVGLACGCLVLLAGMQAAATRVGEQHLALSLPYAYGRNVVNVILVDFRAIDTMGEILVLILAALGVAALLQGKRPHPDDTVPNRRS